MLQPRRSNNETAAAGFLFGHYSVSTASGGLEQHGSGTDAAAGLKTTSPIAAFKLNQRNSSNLIKDRPLRTLQLMSMPQRPTIKSGVTSMFCLIQSRLHPSPTHSNCMVKLQQK